MDEDHYFYHHHHHQQQHDSYTKNLGEVRGQSCETRNPSQSVGDRLLMAWPAQHMYTQQSSFAALCLDISHSHNTH